MNRETSYLFSAKTLGAKSLDGKIFGRKNFDEV